MIRAWRAALRCAAMRVAVGIVPMSTRIDALRDEAARLKRSAWPPRTFLILVLLFAGTAQASSVEVVWTLSATTTVVAQNVYRSTGSGFVKIATLGSSETGYTDLDVIAGQTYGYTVTAVDANGLESVLSNVASATVPNVQPPPVTGVTTPVVSVTATLKGARAANIRWVPGVAATGCVVQSFYIYRSSDQVSWPQRAAVNYKTTLWKDSRLSAASTYGYRVTAFSNVCGESTPIASGLVVTP